jgi:hypothetical protein
MRATREEKARSGVARSFWDTSIISGSLEKGKNAQSGRVVGVLMRQGAGQVDSRDLLALKVVGG